MTPRFVATRSTSPPNECSSPHHATAHAPHPRNTGRNRRNAQYPRRRSPKTGPSCARETRSATLRPSGLLSSVFCLLSSVFFLPSSVFRLLRVSNIDVVRQEE